ncbi:MAG: hypothetical protein L6407_03035, partial [Candidatus Delongbacteria bacterium]|nr:hypothetical protein [Candidatus Delongbacteria bacterium]
MKKWIVLFIAMTFIGLIFWSCSDDEKTTAPTDDSQKVNVTATEDKIVEYNNDFLIFIPAGTFDENVEFTVKKKDNITGYEFSGYEQLGQVYEILHNGLDFNNSVDISFSIESSLDTNNVFIGRYDGNSWQKLETKFNYETNKITAETPGFSLFSLFYGSTPKITGPYASPTEYSGILSGYSFSEDLIFKAELTDEEITLESIDIEISIQSFMSNAINTMVDYANVNFQGYNVLIAPSATNANIVTRFRMNRSVNDFNFTITAEILTGFHQIQNINSVKAKLYATETNGDISVSNEITVNIIETAKPNVELLTPENQIIDISPLIKFIYDSSNLTSDQAAHYTYYKIVIDNTDEPFDAWSKTYSYSDDDQLLGIPGQQTREHQVTKDLEIGKRYWWQVRVSTSNDFDYEDNPEVVCSEIRSFTVVANNPPVINSLTASATSVQQGGTVNLSCSASDADGDALTYTWTKTGGTLSTTTGISPVWTAPTTVGTYTVT